MLRFRNGEHHLGQEGRPEDRASHGSQPFAPQQDAHVCSQGRRRDRAAATPTAAQAALASAEPIMMRAAQKGVVHKNTASRSISRLTRRVKALAS